MLARCSFRCCACLSGPFRASRPESRMSKEPPLSTDSSLANRHATRRSLPTASLLASQEDVVSRERRLARWWIRREDDPNAAQALRQRRHRVGQAFVPRDRYRALRAGGYDRTREPTHRVAAYGFYWTTTTVSSLVHRCKVCGQLAGPAGAFGAVGGDEGCGE